MSSSKNGIAPGVHIGRWTILREVERDKNGNRRWLCRCECGTERAVHGNRLAPVQRSRSCGCLAREIFSSRRGIARAHGENSRFNPSHEYRVWARMIQRCCNPKNPAFHHYGGRGILVCRRWRESYEAFLADVGRTPSEGMSLDRIDVNGNYEPGNVRWATATQQMRNTRRNRFITAFGETKPLCQWAEELGINKDMLRSRLNRGWQVEDALAFSSLARISYARRIKNGERSHVSR